MNPTTQTEKCMAIVEVWLNNYPHYDYKAFQTPAAQTDNEIFWLACKHLGYSVTIKSIKRPIPEVRDVPVSAAHIKAMEGDNS